MAIGDRIKAAAKALFLGNEKPQIEYYTTNAANSDDLRDYVLQCYRDADDEVAKYLSEWRSNREAYLGESYDHYYGLATRFDKQGKAQYYTSDVIADKIGDIISFMLERGVKIYPLPHVNEESQIVTMMASQEGNDMPTVRRYIRKIWEKIFEDVQENQKMSLKDILVILDACLCNWGVTRQGVIWDYRNARYDIGVFNVLPENFLTDSRYATWDDGRFVAEKFWRSPFEVMSEYPDKKEDIAHAIIGKNIARKSARNSAENDVYETKKDLVLYCEGYFKDDTAGDNEYGRKYPYGRKICFLPHVETVLADKPAPPSSHCFPYSVFEMHPTSWRQRGKNKATPLNALQQFDDDVMQQVMANLFACGNNILLCDTDEDVKITNKIALKLKADERAVFYQARGITTDGLMMHGAIQSDSNRISGIENVAEGRPAGSLTSGTALQTLLGGTIRKQGPPNKCFGIFKEEQGKQIADMAMDIYEAGRRLRVSDMDGLPMRLLFAPSEVTDAVDVKVDVDQTLPVNPAELFQLLIQLAPIMMSDGGSLIDRQGIMDMLKIPNAREIDERIQSQLRLKAELQAQQMKQEMDGRAAMQANRTQAGQSAPSQ